MSGLHHMLVHFPIVLWLLAGSIMLLRLVRHTPEWLQMAGLLALALGVVTALAAMLSGLFAWAPEAVLASPLGRNKLAFALWTTAWWSMLLILHWRLSAILFAPGHRLLTAVLVLVGIVLVTITGTLGGLLGGVSAGIPELLRQAGFEVYTTIRLPWWALLVLVASGLGLLRLAGGERRQA